MYVIFYVHDNYVSIENKSICFHKFVHVIVETSLAAIRQPSNSVAIVSLFTYSFIGF